MHVNIDPAELQSVLLLSTYQYHPYWKTRAGGRIGVCSLSKSKKRIGSFECLSFAFEIWTIPHFSNNRISWSYLPPDTTIVCLIMFGYSGLPTRLQCPHPSFPCSHTWVSRHCFPHWLCNERHPPGHVIIVILLPFLNLHFSKEWSLSHMSHKI